MVIDRLATLDELLGILRTREVTFFEGLGVKLVFGATGDSVGEPTEPDVGRRDYRFMDGEPPKFNLE